MENDYVDKISNMTEREVRQRARIKTIEIENELEKKAKKIKPEVFAPYILSFFYDPKRKITIGPHTILQAIEANCAYYKEGYDDEISWNKFANITNLVRGIEDENDFYLWMINKNISLFYQFVYRIQIEVQQTGFSKAHLARYWTIFFDNDYVPRIFGSFEDEYKISIKNWFLCSMSFYAMFNKSVINYKDIRIQSGINVNNKDLNNYLKLSSYSVNDIKKRYHEVRKEISREFHFLIRSAFIERPILDFSNNIIISPIPRLIFRHMGIGLIPLFEQVDNDGYYLGKSFQEYTGRVLNCINKSINLYTNRDLEKKSEGDKSCDFLLVTDTENVLFECKAIDFRVRTLTENAIRNSSAASKVKQSINQIVHTYENINSDKLSFGDVDKSKAFIGVVVTLGEMPGFNSEWFMDNIIDVTAQGISLKRLVILSIDSLEKLIVYLNNKGNSFINLYDEKIKQGYGITGDWDVFLMHKVSELEDVQNLHYIDKTAKKVYESLGISQLNKLLKNN